MTRPSTSDPGISVGTTGPCGGPEGSEAACLRAALKGGDFHAGDEVTCAHGCLTGVILSIDGDEALISWSCRGKSSENVVNLLHIEHEF